MCAREVRDTKGIHCVNAFAGSAFSADSKCVDDAGGTGVCGGVGIGVVPGGMEKEQKARLACRVGDGFWDGAADQTDRVPAWASDCAGNAAGFRRGEDRRAGSCGTPALDDLGRWAADRLLCYWPDLGKGIIEHVVEIPYG